MWQLKLSPCNVFHVIFCSAQLTLIVIETIEKNFCPSVSTVATPEFDGSAFAQRKKKHRKEVTCGPIETTRPWKTCWNDKNVSAKDTVFTFLSSGLAIFGHIHNEKYIESVSSISRLTILLDTMTFEGVFPLLNLWTWIQIFDSDTTFNATQHKALFIGEALQKTRLKLQTRFSLLLNIAHIPEIPHPNLIFKAGKTIHYSSFRDRIDKIMLPCGWQFPRPIFLQLRTLSRLSLVECRYLCRNWCGSPIIWPWNPNFRWPPNSDPDSLPHTFWENEGKVQEKIEFGTKGFEEKGLWILKEPLKDAFYA